jgi:hypothetical protein
LNEGSESLSDDDIKKEIKTEIKKEYAYIARFKGKELSVGKSGQKLISEVITSRLTKQNEDRLVENLSSNWAENFFGIIIQYSQGKRIYQGITDSWEVRCYFAAGMTSNEKFTDKILISMGLRSSQIRELETAKQAGKK